MDVFKQFEKALATLNTIEDEEEKLCVKQSECDNKIQFWLHYVENNKINTKQSYRITRELKLLRKERRRVKDDLDLLRSFHDSESKLKGKDNRSLLLGQLRKLKNRQENWVYTSDAYSEDEVQNILN